jgi:hypothetical protein
MDDVWEWSYQILPPNPLQKQPCAYANCPSAPRPIVFRVPDCVSSHQLIRIALTRPHLLFIGAPLKTFGALL